MSNQLIEDGKIIEINGSQFECVAVSYAEDSEGVKTGFYYSFRLHEEVETERQAAAQAEADRIAAEEGTEPVVDEPTQPEEPKEETQYVR